MAKVVTLDDDEGDGDSGPWCRHFIELGDGCDMVCPMCGHRCAAHSIDGPECREIVVYDALAAVTCDCPGWPDEGETRV